MPQPTPIEVVKGFNAEWALGNIENAIAYIAEDAVYALHISGDVLSHGGEHVGRQKIATVLKKVREEFEYILYRPLQLTADGDTVRFQVEFMYRHRESGERGPLPHGDGGEGRQARAHRRVPPSAGP